MVSTPAGQSRLTIGRLHGRYTLPREHPHPETVRDRLDKMLHSQVQRVMDQVLSPILDPTDPTVWLIRRLDTDLALDLSRYNDRELARLMGGQLSGAIARTLNEPIDGRNILTFADRADYVIHFLVDLAEGRAWGRWYYAYFEGLRSLSISQALREAIIREGELAPTIIQKLADGSRLELILRQLTAGDAGRLLATLRSDQAQTTPLQGIGDRLLSLWPRAGLDPREGWATPQNTLRLWAAWSGQGSPTTALLETFERMLTLADFLTELAEPQLFISLLVRGEIGAAVAEARRQGLRNGLETLPQIQWLAGGDPSWFLEAIQTIRPAAGSEIQREHSTFATSNLVTPCGSLFLLLPGLIDLGIPELLARHVPGQYLPMWRYWLFLKCLGSSRIARFQRDPLLLRLAKLQTPPDRRQLQEAAGAIGEEGLKGMTADYLGHLLSQGRVSGQLIALDWTEGSKSDRPILVARDMENDFWLLIDAVDQEEALARVVEVTGAPASIVWAQGQPQPAGLEKKAPDYIRRAKPVGDSLTYFDTPAVPAGMDGVLTLFAQGILRAFARRLMGFAWSSPSYLYDNFLTGNSVIQSTAEAMTVETPHVPLGMILRMTSLADQTLTIPWLDDLPATLILA